MGEIGPFVAKLFKNESTSSEQKTSSGSLSEGQMLLLQTSREQPTDSVSQSNLLDSISRDEITQESIDSGMQESQIQDEMKVSNESQLKSPDGSFEDHSSSQIQTTSINISMIAHEDK
jgi:hypothetical protein